jgi:D-alanyl-D-alanine carboxypeptidase (penicillin-binding protein 5/6)
MNNERSPSQRERLPVIAQLVLLVTILVTLFGSLWYIESVNRPPLSVHTVTPTVIQPLPPVTQRTDHFSTITIEGAAAYVWDIKTQRVLYQKNADEILPLASITKLMTSLLTHELFAPTQPTSLSLQAIQQDGDYGLRAGEGFTTAELHTLSLLSSSNDAAFALGASVGAALGERDAADQFVSGMNIRAAELGFDSFVFKNPTGLDVSVAEPGALGSARDVTHLMEYIVTNYPELLSDTTQSKTVVYNSEGAYHEVFNTNELIGEIPNLIASKTGYTDLAGGNLTVAFDAGLNRPIIITVLGSTREGRFRDVATLVEAVQHSFSTQ